MRPPWLVSWVLCLALSHWKAGAFVLHLETDCPLSADGQVLWANWTLSFNKVPFVCYDNDYQKFLPCGLGASVPWNYTAVPISSFLDHLAPKQGQLAQQSCQQQLQSLWGRTGGRRTRPNIRIFPVTPRNTIAPIMLACVAWGFYPEEVDITWLWNGSPVKDGMGTPVVSSNGDWTYQARLTLPVDPQLGGTYTCCVTHASLPKPLTEDWVPGLPLDMRIKVGVSMAILGMGFLSLIAGLIFWNKRVPEGYSPIEGSTYPEDR